VLLGKKSNLRTCACILGIFLIYTWIAFYAVHVALPSPEQPLIFYSNQTRDDLKALFIRALSASSESIDLQMYGLTDPDLEKILVNKAALGLPVTVQYDPSASFQIKERLPYPIRATPSTCKGLMHKKLVVTDKKNIFLGSANFTPASLLLHDNLCIGIYHPEFATETLDPKQKKITFSIGKTTGELFLLPDFQNKAKESLLHLILSAKKSIHVAMFTLTHTELVHALIVKKNEGVEVICILDFYTARGASHKALEQLLDAKIPVRLSRGQELLHYKWAIIDKRTLIMGSANWTQSAFKRNEDYLLILSHLPKEHRKFLKNLWKIVKFETIEYNPK